ncbi:MAG: hypothetical protein KJO30_03290 [Boseongicola sp.]|nr:hypothetical protein [Boseongicola sp.]
MTAFRISCVAVFMLFLGAMTAVTEPRSAVLTEIVHTEAALEVIGLDGQRTIYSPAELEQFPTYQLTTVTPWRDEPAVFAGVLLSDVLAHHNLLSADELLVTAENEFTVSFDRAALTAAPILIATRVNGAPHSRRSRGPIQFVIDDHDMRSREVLTESHLVWMAARIEVVR